MLKKKIYIYVFIFIKYKTAPIYLGNTMLDSIAVSSRALLTLVSESLSQEKLETMRLVESTSTMFLGTVLE